MSKDNRMGGKQKHGHSRSGYFARRKMGLAKRNKEWRIARHRKLMLRISNRSQVNRRRRVRPSVPVAYVVSYLGHTYH